MKTSYKTLFAFSLVFNAILMLVVIFLVKNLYKSKKVHELIDLSYKEDIYATLTSENPNDLEDLKSNLEAYIKYKTEKISEKTDKDAALVGTISLLKNCSEKEKGKKGPIFRNTACSLSLQVSSGVKIPKKLIDQYLGVPEKEYNSSKTEINSGNKPEKSGIASAYIYECIVDGEKKLMLFTFDSNNILNMVGIDAHIESQKPLKNK